MSDEKLQNKLYEKMATEQARYRNWLISQSSEEILNHAAEYTIREDIMMEVSVLELSEVHTKALLKSRTPLEDIYREWQNTETRHMEDIRDMIEARANAMIRTKQTYER